jgi:LPS O-antigen subunit length determinant protein (WzzB/FepE family)
MNQQHMPPHPIPVADDEIDLIVLAKTLWNGRKTIFYSIGGGIILGLFVALSSPKEYTVSTVMVPQLGGDQSKLGGLSGLAALAGVNLDMTQGSELSPLVYPQIVNSIPFRLELMNTPLNFKGLANPVSLFDFYTKYSKPSLIGVLKKYTIGLPGVILSVIKGKPKEITLPGDSLNRIITLTEDQMVVQKTIGNMVTLQLNAKEGYITLVTKLSEPLATAQLAQRAQKLLQTYITEFKIEKAKANLDFIQGRYNETKTEFEKAQVSLAVVNDRNKNFTSVLPLIETDRIQTKYTITFGVFQELAKQLEQAKIQVKKDTPVFTIVEPVTVPTERSKPKRSMILAIWFCLGGVAGVGWVFGKQYFGNIKERWNEKSEV